VDGLVFPDTIFLRSAECYSFTSELDRALGLPAGNSNLVLATTVKDVNKSELHRAGTTTGF
jgi:hypothetical protein